MALQEIARLQEQLKQVANPVNFLANLFAYAPVGFAIFKADGHRLLTNKAFRDLFGSEPPPDYNILTDSIAAASGLAHYFQRAFAGETVQLPVFWYDPRDLTTVTVTEGHRVAISMNAFPLFDEQGNVAYVAATYKDETEIMLAQEHLRLEADEKSNTIQSLQNEMVLRRQTELALIESQEQLRLLVQGGLDYALFLLDPLGNVLTWNMGAERLKGYHADEIVGQHFSRFYTEADVLDGRPARLLQLAQDNKFVATDGWRVRKDGSQFWASVVITALYDDNGHLRGFSKLTRDMSERKQAELALQAKDEELRNTTQQLWQTARLATMGELAANIAHEINNPLAIALLRIESVFGTLKPGTPEHRSLEIVDNELERMSKLVVNLLDFSRRSNRQVSTLNVHEEIERSLEILQYQLNARHITAQVECPLDIPLIPGDRQQLRQLFLNLFTNASDAMPSGGQLTITLSPGGANSPSGITVVVTDSGIGIPPEAMARLWEPFFTTKPEGKGTGLGLPICRRIVQEHSGTINVQSQVGQGTTVHIELPGAPSNLEL